jgi:hypothetical protein
VAAAGYQIHKQQLFHWIGQGIQSQNKGNKVLSDALAGQAIDHIRASVSNGLWVKIPRVPELFTLGFDSLALRTPISCFTEWSLGDSLPHTDNYGRIGFGFPKKWVIARGGQSVTYFRHAADSNFLKTIFALLKSVGDPIGNGDWTPKAGHSLDEVLYLVHFAKMVRAAAAKAAKKIKAKVVAPAVKAKVKKAAMKAVPAPSYRRKFGAELEFVEEREWRIVYHPSIKHFKPGPASGFPNHYLPYIPGEELFTLVVPDHKVLNALLQDRWITKRLFTPHLIKEYKLKTPVPAVTVLAHSDLGTF